jgi:hypothetical protein
MILGYDLYFNDLEYIYHSRRHVFLDTNVLIQRKGIEFDQLLKFDEGYDWFLFVLDKTLFQIVASVKIINGNV